MCKLCETSPVYEFTNQRKLCKTCFIHYFEKKVLYTLRKFNFVKLGNVIGYKKKNDYGGAVLENILNFLSEKSHLEIVKLPNKRATILAIGSSLDSEADEIVRIMIQENCSKLKKELPITGNLIKPLYLFLDEEILLYAKLKGIKFAEHKIRKNAIGKFLDEFEKKHPEVKRAVVNSLLELYSKKN